VFCGSPCSGKSTIVRKQAVPGDLVVEFDRLAQALTPSDSHDHGLHPEVKTFVFSAHNAVLKRLRFSSGVERAWLTALAPTNEQRARYLIGPDARMTILAVDPAIAHQRAKDDGRPSNWHDLIDDYFVRFEEPDDPRIEIRVDF
jgi:hypothetical protein